MRYEPSGLEMFLTALAFRFYGGRIYKAFADRLPLRGEERVLDFGCGMGTVAYYAAKRLPQGRLTCLDISERWLTRCRRTLRKCGSTSFLHAEATALSEDSFDVIYCHFVLHDIADSALESVVPALARALAPGGALVFREPLRETEKLGRIKRLMEKSSLLLKDSRITDVPLMGNALESVYTKTAGGSSC